MNTIKISFIRLLVLNILLGMPSLSFSQTGLINIEDFGAKGNGQFDNSAAIQSAINSINKGNDLTIGRNYTLYFPPGIYDISRPIVLPKPISILGSSSKASIIKVTSIEVGGIIIPSSGLDSNFTNLLYTTIKDITITGPDYNKNCFAWKDIKRNNDKSVGIIIEKGRTRIENCTINGFLWAGIQSSGSYYNNIENDFILNNRIGIMISNGSTSMHVTNSEIRFNSIGMQITGNSFGNFITNNTFEANIATFLDSTQKSPYQKGIGILIENSPNNFINDNYFEDHFTQITLNNSKDNTISQNFFAMYQNETLLSFIATCTENKISDNTVLSSNKVINPYVIKFSDNRIDYSSNVIDFGKTNNKIIQNNLIKSRSPNTLPTLPQ